MKKANEETRIHECQIKNVVVKYIASVFNCDLELQSETYHTFYTCQIPLHSSGVDVMSEILKILEVIHWRDLKGKDIRCQINVYGLCIAIGHLRKDQWLSFEKFKEGVT